MKMLSYESSHAVGSNFSAPSSSIDGLQNGHLAPSPQEPGSVIADHAYRHIWLITGPAGCGKSSVAEFIAKSLKLPFLEGDNFHPTANIDKMSHGIPLTDQDRWDWLISLRTAAVKSLTTGVPGVVLTCSALKKKYRDVIRIAHYFSPNVLVHFVFLHASEDVLLKRVLARQGHYMGPQMVHSQFEALEVPGSDEPDVLTVDVSGTKAAVESEALRQIRRTVDGQMGIEDEVSS